MATEAQILANRRNALYSTGPRSVEGKAASRFNALKTGIQATSLVIPGEDPAELQELASGYHREFQPATPLERFVVDSLIHDEWQIRRYHAIEARLWEQALSVEDSNLGEAYTRNLPAFTRLHRRLESAERSYYRALQELRRLQASKADELDLGAQPLAPDPPPPAGELASFSVSREIAGSAPLRPEADQLPNKALRL
jgi:hypothetical protein